jgi:hypothetical protein
MIEFIMHASDNYDLYGLGEARLLVDRHTLKVVYDYDDEVALI